MTAATPQSKQQEWFDQWNRYQAQELFLFKDWIFPFTLEDFRECTVLEAGCGSGQHTAFIAPFAKSVVAVDLNTVPIARERNQAHRNVSFVEGDIGTLELGQQFDVVLSIGVVHHTDDPDRTVANLIHHLKPGGTLLLWVYSQEGNWLTERVIEPFRRTLLARRSRDVVAAVSWPLTVVLMGLAYTLYRLPIPGLPYAEYLKNARAMSWRRNFLNIFDKLNAPQTQLISRVRAEKWLSPALFEAIRITPYCGVSWRVQGRLKKT